MSGNLVPAVPPIPTVDAVNQAKTEMKEAEMRPFALTRADSAPYDIPAPSSTNRKARERLPATVAGAISGGRPRR